jgi:hypothetical protein
MTATLASGDSDPNFAPAYNCRGLLKNVKLMDVGGALGDFI